MKTTYPLTCPWCGMCVEPNQIKEPQSAHVLLDATSDEPVKMYVENPDKAYKTHIATRKAGLRYYYRNRERVLAREKARRERLRALQVEK